MSGVDDLMRSNDRWADAARRAQGVVDFGLGHALKVYYTRFFPAALVVLVAAGAVGGALIFGPEDWVRLLWFGGVLATSGLVICAFVYNAKRITPAAEVGKTDLLYHLEDAERKDLRRQILGKAPADAKHLAVSRAAAVQLRKNLATQLVWGSVVALLLFTEAIGGHGLLAWLLAAAGPLALGGILLGVRDFQRTGKFLERTAPPDQPGVSGRRSRGG